MDGQLVGSLDMGTTKVSAMLGIRHGASIPAASRLTGDSDWSTCQNPRT